jgi:Fe-Mn family superoxide dismutase
VKKSAILGAAAVAAPTIITSSFANAQQSVMKADMYPYSLPPLNYPKGALMPYIDEQTMTIHHDKHHQGYVDGLNKALEGHEELQAMTPTELLKNLDTVPSDIQVAVRNSGGGHVNHTLFWKLMSPKGGGDPRGALGEEIHAQWKGFQPLREEFTKAAGGLFGSGWAWLVLDQGSLKVTTTPNQGTPLSSGQTPLLGIDVWEHAYYLKYNNRRSDYISAWMNVVDWGYADGLFIQARSQSSLK